jgi:hypothetical protein
MHKCSLMYRFYINACKNDINWKSPFCVCVGWHVSSSDTGVWKLGLWMSDFLRKWIVGIGVTWLSCASACGYVLFGGPIPRTDRYLEGKYVRAIERHSELDGLDEGLHKELERRRNLRQLWSQSNSGSWLLIKLLFLLQYPFAVGLLVVVFTYILTDLLTYCSMDFTTLNGILNFSV